MIIKKFNNAVVVTSGYYRKTNELFTDTFNINILQFAKYGNY